MFSLKYNLQISAIFNYFKKATKNEFLWFTKQLLKL
jgi:hypothetical protein